MKSFSRVLVGVALGVATTAAVSGVSAQAGLSAGDKAGTLDTSGMSIFAANDPCPVQDFPTFESIAPVPTIIDPFEQDLVPVFCQITVMRGSKPVKNARGTFVSELFTTQTSSGSASGFQVDSGKFRTNENGIASFDFDLPTAIFADGFESGDVSAWSYTRADFSNKKKATNATLSCDAQGSR